MSEVENNAELSSNGLWRVANRVASGLSFSLTVAASATIASFMVLIFADVVMRKFFSRPIFGVAEFVAYAIVAAIFFQLGSTMRNGKLITADFLMAGWEKWPVLSEGLKTIFYSISVLLLASIVSWLVGDALKAWTSGDYAGAVGAFQMPLWPFKLATAIGAIVAICEASLILIGHVAGFSRALSAGALWKNGLRGLLIFLALAGLVLGLLVYGDLSRMQLGGLAFAVLFALVACGMPVAFALIATSFVAIWAIRNNIDIAGSAMGISAAGTVRSFEFGVVPLFVMMGLVLDRADVGRDAFRVAVVLLRKVRGGLANATVAANAVFAAITGSSIASAAVFSRIAVPPMVEAGYSKRFAVGVVAGSSVLGMLIPPSLLLIIYGLVAETSVGALFIAAIVPGILLAFCFGVLNVTLVTFAKKFVGNPDTNIDVENMTLREIAANLAPIAFLIFLVMGGIYGGFFSPTEAGAIGALGAFLIAAVRKKLNWQTIKEVVLSAGYITSSILFLIVAASLYSRMLALSSIPSQMAVFIGSQQLSLVGFCLAYMLLVLMLGMILDSVSILLIVLPVALPVVTALGGDLTWFGIVTIVSVEMGLLTPPFGLAVFVVKGSLPDNFVSLGDIFIGVAPYVLTMLLFTVILILVPGIALVLL